MSGLTLKDITGNIDFLYNQPQQTFHNSFTGRSAILDSFMHVGSDGKAYYLDNVLIGSDGLVQAFNSGLKLDVENNIVEVEMPEGGFLAYYTTIPRYLEKWSPELKTWLTDEAMRAIYEAYEMACIIGVTDADSFEPMVDSPLAATIPGTQSTLASDITTAVGMIKGSNEVFAVVSKANMAYIRQANLNDLGATVIEADWMPDDKVAVYSKDAYAVKGDTVAESFENLKLAVNERELLVEIWGSGTVFKPDSVVIIEVA